MSRLETAEEFYVLLAAEDERRQRANIIDLLKIRHSYDLKLAAIAAVREKYSSPPRAADAESEEADENVVKQQGDDDRDAGTGSTSTVVINVADAAETDDESSVSEKKARRRVRKRKRSSSWKKEKDVEPVIVAPKLPPKLQSSTLPVQPSKPQPKEMPVKKTPLVTVTQVKTVKPAAAAPHDVKPNAGSKVSAPGGAPKARGRPGPKHPKCPPPSPPRAPRLPAAMMRGPRRLTGAKKKNHGDDDDDDVEVEEVDSELPTSVPRPPPPPPKVPPPPPPHSSPPPSSSSSTSSAQALPSRLYGKGKCKGGGGRRSADWVDPLLHSWAAGRADSWEYMRGQK